MQRSSGLRLITRDYIDEVFKVLFKGCDISVMALFQKQHRLPFKQGYDNLRLSR